MIYKVDKKEEWYLNFYTLRHICNNHEKYIDFRLKTYKFIMIGKNIIKLN